MGGRIALHVALAAPARVERLVLIGASPGLADAAERAARRAADEQLAARDRALEHRGVRRSAGRRRRCWPGSRRRSPRAVHATGCATTPAGLAAALRGLGTGAMPPLWDRLGELTMPVALVVGERDEKFRRSRSRWRRRCPTPR